jgi:hypothetical protein
MTPDWLQVIERPFPSSVLVILNRAATDRRRSLTRDNGLVITKAPHRASSITIPWHLTDTKDWP